MKYPPGFEQAWAAYPHYQMRKRKKLAVANWVRDELEPLTENVLQWIEACRDSDDWQKDGGMYVPAMQAWLNQTDFEELPDGAKAKYTDEEKARKILEFDQKHGRKDAEEAS